MKISLVQMSPVTGDLNKNLGKIKKEIVVAREKGADLVVFPEMAITGYCISDLIEDELFVKRNKELLYEIAKETKEIAVIIGFIDYDNDKKNNDGRIRKYNAAALIYKEKILGISHKALLPNYRYFDDKRYFSPGKERKVFCIKIKGKEVKLGISICEDMWDKDYEIKPIKELVQKGAEIIININASPFFPGKINEREKIILRHIKEIGLPFIYLNTVGSADNGKNIIPFDGQSLVFNNEGNLISIGKQFEEENIIVELNQKTPIAKPIQKREEELFKALVMSLKDYANQTGFKKAIVPLSGGIDSALGLVITAEAFGNENVTAYNLPSRFNTETTKGIAQKIAKNLKIKYKIIPIQEIDNNIKVAFEKNAHEIKNEVAKENLHARIRGILMMLESNDTDALLISNGNKTEIALGYSTLYGDMCGGISVIGDLSKTEVYKICRYINQRYKREIIPEKTFKIKPSAELSERQYDPFDYETVSPLVGLFVEERDSPAKILEKFRDRKLGDRFNGKIYDLYTQKNFEKIVYDVYNLLKKSVYKRLQGPPIIVVTGRSFGFDLRETLINKWGGR